VLPVFSSETNEMASAIYIDVTLHWLYCAAQKQAGQYRYHQ